MRGKSETLGQPHTPWLIKRTQLFEPDKELIYIDLSHKNKINIHNVGVISSFGMPPSKALSKMTIRKIITGVEANKKTILRIH